MNEHGCGRGVEDDNEMVYVKPIKKRTRNRQTEPLRSTYSWQVLSEANVSIIRIFSTIYPLT